MPEAQSPRQKQNEITSTADRVVVVPARKALDEYFKYAAYICQPNRTFQDCVHMAFYTNNKIDRHIPRIISNVKAISLNDIETRTDITDADRARLRTLLAKLDTERKNELVKGQRDIYFLTPSDSPDTLILPHDIANNATAGSGKNIVFTQHQRYVSLSLLEKGPQNTDELV